MRPLDLDRNATTPLLPAAWDAMRAAPAGNPSSAHSAGRRARQALEDARERVAALLGAHPDEVTFTGGATEANNLAVLGLSPDRAAASHLEHPCVVEPLKHLAARGAAALPPGVHLHCDAAQAVGKIPVNFRDLGATTLAASAHKFGGPKGVGVLVAKRGAKLPPLMYGGHQQQGRRPGTEPVPLAAGMAAALEVAVRDLAANRAKLESLRARLWQRLRELAAPVVLNGPEVGAADVVPTTLNASFPGCRADVLLMALDLAGVACSTGSACSSGSLLPSPVLRAMGVPDDVLRSAMRFSFGPDLDVADMDEAADRVAAAVRQVRESG